MDGTGIWHPCRLPTGLTRCAQPIGGACCLSGFGHGGQTTSHRLLLSLPRFSGRQGRAQAPACSEPTVLHVLDSTVLSRGALTRCSSLVSLRKQM